MSDVGLNQALSEAPSGRLSGSMFTARECRLPALVLLFFAGLFWFVGHHQWTFGGRLTTVAPRALDGDEPQYLIIVNSLLHDHDLDLANNYRDAEHGSLDLGVRLRSAILEEHHTFLINRQQRTAIRWIHARARPEWVSVPGLLELSWHPVGFPALIAAMLRPFQPDREDVERRAVEAVILLSWLAVVVTYFAGRRSGLLRDPALLAAAFLGLCSPFLAYSHSFYSEPVIALFLVLGLWAMQAERYAAAGCAVAAAIWMKPNFVIIGIAWAAERLWARRPRAALVLAGVTLIGTLASVAFNHAIAYQSAIGVGEIFFAHGFESFTDTLFSKRHGLLPFVPWTLLIVMGIRSSASRGPSSGSGNTLLPQVAFPAIAHLGVLSVIGFGPGYCYGPRYWIPLLPWLALAAVHVAVRSGRVFRAGLTVLAIGSALIAVPAALRYEFLYSAPVLKAWDSYRRPRWLTNAPVKADFVPQLQSLRAQPKQALVLPVRIFNRSAISFVAGDDLWEPWMALSYHLLDTDGHLLQSENARSPVRGVIEPHGVGAVDLAIQAPAQPGRYRIEIDMVWEGVCWFKDRGNVPALVDLEVQ